MCQNIKREHWKKEVSEVNTATLEEEELAKKKQGTLQGLEGQLEYFVTRDNVVVVIDNEVRKLELLPSKGQTVWVPPRDSLDLTDYEIGKEIKLCSSGRVFQLLPDCCVLDGKRFPLSLFGRHTVGNKVVSLVGGGLKFWIGPHRPWLCPTLVKLTFINMTTFTITTTQSTKLTHLLLGDGVGRLVEVVER